MTVITCRILLVAALLHGPTGAAFAAEPDEGNSEPRHHRHHVAVFLGGAVRDEHHTESGFAVGLDYEYLLTHLLGAGLLVEVATGDLDTVTVVFPLVLHPWRGLRFVAAPGMEIPDHGDVEFAMRLGTGYHFPFGDLTVGPEFNVDLVEGEPTYVIGVSFGWGF
ncbi:MAG: hypothetical protein JRH16_03265 [Deltaproteobacteria bacterium]|nr:hypothetical protein [Deltaproteobacteria bacterium]MBW2362996.1 hypothetical protein [Deltaproteobacteria bacterium]